MKHKLLAKSNSRVYNWEEGEYYWWRIDLSSFHVFPFQVRLVVNRAWRLRFYISDFLFELERLPYTIKMGQMSCDLALAIFIPLLGLFLSSIQLCPFLAEPLDRFPAIFHGKFFSEVTCHCLLLRGSDCSKVTQLA